MVHKLKIDSDMFRAVLSGRKTFEIRYNLDRDFQVYDELLLQETKYTAEEMKNGMPLEYTGNQWQVQITYILKGPIYGLQDGWVIMSII